jgi:hypothetical protein
MEQKGVRYGRPGEDDEQVGCRTQTGERWEMEARGPIYTLRLVEL